MNKLTAGNSFKILIAEDNAVSRRLLEATLTKWNYEVIVTTNGKEALEVLKSENPPQIAVLDWIMPEMNGIDVCREIRTTKKEPYIYIIMLSARGEKEDIVEGMNSGADDYIAKPFHSHELNVRIKAGRRIIELEEDLISVRNQLQIQATHDNLTGILNRGAIMDLMHNEMSRAERTKKPIGILMADIDHFKSVNDNYGHLSGDAVLREIVVRIQTALRPYDAVGRYGGEEFLLILPDCNEIDLYKIAERIRAQVSDKEFAIPEGSVTVTISIGATVIESAQDSQSEVFIKKADVALYKAKEEGRNCIR